LHPGCSPDAAPKRRVAAPERGWPGEAVCASTFDMYSLQADAIREKLTRELASRLDYRVEELCLYQAACAIAKPERE
jgi:hypothetical protein